jgi:hypothetical protein
LLPHGERDEAAQLDELGLGEMRVEALPEPVVGFQPPGNGFGVGERRFLALAVPGRFLEIDEVVGLALPPACPRTP